MSYQKLIIQGNVGQVHEPKYTQAGDMVLGFSVAYSDGKDKPTTWFNCTAFKNTAETVSKYVKKGNSILVEGRIKCEKYTAKDGTEKEAWKVDVSQIALLGNKRDGEQDAHSESKSNGYAPKQSDSVSNDFTSDIPFAEPCRHYNLWRSM